MAVTPIRRLCTLSTDTNLLATVEAAAHDLGFLHNGASDCNGCSAPCAALVAVDLDRSHCASLVSGIPRLSGNALMGILPNNMSVQVPKQLGIEVVVYRELMQRFLPVAMKLALLLVDGENTRLNGLVAEQT